VDPGRYTALFLSDSREQLRRAGSLLLEWEHQPSTLEPVPELFRAFHSVKGAASALGYRPVAELAHAAEQLLDAVRRGELSGSKAVAGLLLRAVDVLEAGVERSAAGEPPPDSAELAASLERMAASGVPRDVSDPRAGTDLVGPLRARSASVRVSQDRLDELLARAGELVVASEHLDAAAARGRDPGLEAVAARVGSLVRANYAGVLDARLAPLTELFGRFPRVVRDLGQALGRHARLELHSDGIEMDRGLLEELADPLVHLVRNAVDHGIELPSERVARGKPAEGRLTLAAERVREWITIRLSDDGRGIDPVAVAARAAALGLRAPGGPPVDGAELLRVLARPGFTLSERVTEVSGRGVGMDVVVSTVRGLGGRVELESVVGAGTTIRLTVPMTTALQRVLLVGASGERYGIPFRIVAEALLAESPRDSTAGGGTGFTFRGRTLPLVDLTAAIGAAPAAPARPSRRPVLILEWGSREGALAVDAMLGQRDVLIEPVAAPSGLPAWVSGATILADGMPAFVLDPTALF
jgi:two-component system chemotaxis sensor kinase CheA